MEPKSLSKLPQKVERLAEEFRLAADAIQTFWTEEAKHPTASPTATELYRLADMLSDIAKQVPKPEPKKSGKLRSRFTKREELELYRAMGSQPMQIYRSCRPVTPAGKAPPKPHST